MVDALDLVRRSRIAASTCGSALPIARKIR